MIDDVCAGQFGGLTVCGLSLQLCRGASTPERKRWCLPEHVEAFKYLAGSGCSEIAGTDDTANFGVVRNSLSRLGISDSQQVRVWHEYTKNYNKYAWGEVAEAVASAVHTVLRLHQSGTSRTLARCTRQHVAYP